MTARVLCIGDVMLDVITKIAVMPDKINYGSDTPATISTHGGGAAGNVASWLTRTEAEATIVAHVGDDPAGAALVSEFDALGVLHKNLVVEKVHSGVVVVLVDPTGERTMFPDNGANSGLHIGDLPELDEYNAVYLSGYSPLDPLSRPGVMEMITKIKEAGLPLYFDPASVGGMMEVSLEEVKSWIRLMDVILLNEEEAIYLTGETNPEKALELGLVNRVVPYADLMAEAHALAEKIAVNAPLSVQASKRIALQITSGTRPAEDAYWQLNTDESIALMRSEDAREGPRAFAEKRAPVWKAR